MTGADSAVIWLCYPLEETNRRGVHFSVKKTAPIHLLSGVRSVLFLPVCTIVPFSDAWDGHPPHVAEKHALVANAVAKDTVHLPPGEG